MLFGLARHMQRNRQKAHELSGPSALGALTYALPRHVRPGSELSLLPGIRVSGQRRLELPIRWRHWPQAAPRWGGETVQQVSNPAHAKIFHFQIVLEAMTGTLPPDAGLFDPAKRCRLRGHASRVDANHAIFQSLCHTPDPLQV